MAQYSPACSRSTRSPTATSKASSIRFNADFCLARLQGSVVGTFDGAATEMEIKGVYMFDRKLDRVTKLNLAVKEKRSIGGATRGLDGVAKLKMKMKPITRLRASHGRRNRAAAQSRPTRRRTPYDTMARSKVSESSTIANGSSPTKSVRRRPFGESIKTM